MEKQKSRLSYVLNIGSQTLMCLAVELLVLSPAKVSCLEADLLKQHEISSPCDHQSSHLASLLHKAIH